MAEGKKTGITWEKALDIAIKTYKMDLDLLREYDLRKDKATRPAS